MCKKLVLFAHKPKKSWLDKKKDLLAEKQDLFEKKCEEKSLLRKKGFVLQKNRNCKSKKV